MTCKCQHVVNTPQRSDVELLLAFAGTYATRDCMNTQTMWRFGSVNNYKTALDKKFLGVNFKIVMGLRKGPTTCRTSACFVALHQTAVQHASVSLHYLFAKVQSSSKIVLTLFEKTMFKGIPNMCSWYNFNHWKIMFCAKWALSWILSQLTKQLGFLSTLHCAAVLLDSPQ